MSLDGVRCESQCSSAWKQRPNRERVRPHLALDRLRMDLPALGELLHRHRVAGLRNQSHRARLPVHGTSLNSPFGPRTVKRADLTSDNWVATCEVGDGTFSQPNAKDTEHR